MSPCVQRLRVHIEELLAEHLISADYERTGAAHVDVGGRHVLVPPIESVDDYRVALGAISGVVAATADERVSRGALARSWEADLQL